ncbi:MAG: D-alanine--D-alanine ligase [Oscillospiraceae bacterium]|nr:D-alanine--D-alanine ligase [Oscillospiraceae bacterium]
MARIKLLVLFGGVSNDYSDSLASAVSVLQTLPDEKYEVVPVGINKKGRWLYFPGDYAEILNDKWSENTDCTSAVLSPDPAHRGILILEDGSYTLKRIDAILSLLQGSYGEDGAIQGLCELSRIPYVGNSISSSAVCRNKALTHTLLQDAGIQIPNWLTVPRRNLSRLDRECDRIEAAMDYPLYIKPSGSDSAAASGIAQNRNDLAAMIKRAFTQDTTVLIEELCEGREFRVAVFGYDMPFASFPGELNRSKDLPMTVPADLDDETVRIMRETAIAAFRVLECKELALIDFYLTVRGEILLGEVNTMPALSEHAPYPVLMGDLGMRYPYLIEKLIEQAAEHADRGF